MGPGRVMDRGDWEVRLSEGMAWVPSRTMLRGADLERVRSGADEVEVFLRWSRLVAEHDLPRLAWFLTAANPNVPASLVVTDSPLVVAAFLDALPAELPDVVVVDRGPGDPDAWPVVGAEGHHLAELVVAWRQPGYWSAVMSSGGAAAVRPSLPGADTC